MTDGAPAGWFADPDDDRQFRFWDGTAWTDHRAPRFATAEATTSDADAVAPAVTTAAALGTSPEPSTKRSGSRTAVGLAVVVAAVVGLVVLAPPGLLPFLGDDCARLPKAEVSDEGRQVNGQMEVGRWYCGTAQSGRLFEFRIASLEAQSIPASEYQAHLPRERRDLPEYDEPRNSAIVTAVVEWKSDGEDFDAVVGHLAIVVPGIRSLADMVAWSDPDRTPEDPRVPKVECPAEEEYGSREGLGWAMTCLWMVEGEQWSLSYASGSGRIDFEQLPEG